MTTTKLELVSISKDGGTQPRAAIDPDTVGEYAEAMKAGAKFPPIVVFHDGQEYWLADGFHRVQAATRAMLIEISADVRQGTRRDAVLYSVGANSEHGMRRTNADKRRAVMTLLNDEKWGKWSDREIARQCRVGNKFVSDIRRSLCPEHSGKRTYTTKHGTTATMATSNINASRRNTGAIYPKIDTADPEQAARALSISLEIEFLVKMVDYINDYIRRECDASN